MSARVATVFFGRTTFGGYRRHTETATIERRCTAVGVVRCVEADAYGPNRILMAQLGTNANKAEVFKAHTTPQDYVKK